METDYIVDLNTETFLLEPEERLINLVPQHSFKKHSVQMFQIL